MRKPRVQRFLRMWVAIITISAMLAGTCAFASETPLSLMVTPNKTSAQVGDTIEWTIRVQGGDGAYQLSYQPYITFSNGSGWTGNSTYGIQFDGSYQYSFTPNEAGSHWLYVRIEDKAGRSVSNLGNAIHVNVMGAVANALALSVKCDKASTYIGNDVTWTIRVDGGTPPYRVQYHVFNVYANGSFWTNNTMVDTSNNPIVYKFTPFETGTLWLYVGVQDAAGRLVSNLTGAQHIPVYQTEPTPTPPSTPTPPLMPTPTPEHTAEPTPTTTPSTPTPDSTPDPNRITITPATGRLYVGSTQKLSADKEGITWSSSNSKIATVSKKGIVKGRKAGDVVITATDRSGVQGSVSISIVNKLKSIKFADKTIKLGLYDNVYLVVVPKPIDVDFEITRWTSSKPNIVRVDDDGFVLALTIGKSKITAVSSTGKKATCTVVVKP